MKKTFSFSRTFFVASCTAFTLIIASITFAGWVADVHILRSLVPGLPAIRPLTSLGFIISAAGLGAALLPRRSKSGRIFSISAGGLVALVSITIFAASLENAFGGSGLGINEYNIFPESERLGVSPIVPLMFVFLGLAVAASHSARRPKRPTELFATTVIIVVYGVVLGQLYNANAPYLILPLDPVAIPSIILFVVMSAGLIAIDPRSRLLGLLGSNTLGGTAARRLIPTVVIIPTLIGWVRVLGQELGFYDTGLGSTMATFTLVLLMLAIVMYYSRTVHNADRQRRRMEMELAAKEMRYRELFDYSQGLICIHDLEGRLTTVNRAALHLLGYSEAEMIGANLREFVSKDRHPEFDAYIRKVTNEGLANGLLELVARSGRRVVLRYNNVLAMEQGKEPYVLGHAQDVTELLAAQRKLKDLSLTDELTGLYNRRGFLTLAEQQLKLERHNGTARGLTLLFLDMDGLKAINDTYGHEAGSNAIVTLGRLVKSVVRGADIVARWGGDEFVVLTIGAKGENAGLMVDRIHECLDEHNATSREPYLIACSIGVAPIDLDSGQPFEEVIARADEAMYADKKRRKAAGGEASDPPNPLVREWGEHARGFDHYDLLA